MVQIVCNRDGEVVEDHRGLPLPFAFFNKVIETKRLEKSALVGRKRLVSIHFSADATKLLNRRLPYNYRRISAVMY